jgi:hypothetical protein
MFIKSDANVIVAIIGIVCQSSARLMARFTLHSLIKPVPSETVIMNVKSGRSDHPANEKLAGKRPISNSFATAWSSCRAKNLPQAIASGPF